MQVIIIKPSAFGASASASAFGGTNEAHATWDPLLGVPKSSTHGKPLVGQKQPQEQKLHNKAHVTCDAVPDVLKSGLACSTVGLLGIASRQKSEKYFRVVHNFLA